MFSRLTAKKDTNGETAALVLLSGGIDSIAALHWALDPDSGYAGVAAFSLDYGQLHRDQELTVAQSTADRRGVPWARARLTGLPRMNTSPGVTVDGVSRAFVPGRNMMFLSSAAGHAATLWPGGAAHVIIGCNVDDAAAFPDCRPRFIEAASIAIAFALSGVAGVGVKAPWLGRSWTKAEIIRWASDRPLALADVRASVSCYRGTRCGECDACTLRARAFADAGVEDGCAVATRMHGGDPGRDARMQ